MRSIYARDIHVINFYLHIFNILNYIKILQISIPYKSQGILIQKEVGSLSSADGDLRISPIKKFPGVVEVKKPMTWR